ncbi:hypothetical protein [Hymenobacter rigui]|nr:hypothetical protein [Hymenobacter rigui]
MTGSARPPFGYRPGRFAYRQRRGATVRTVAMIQPPATEQIPAVKAA